MQTGLTRFRPVFLAGALWLALSTATRIALALRPDIGEVAGFADWTRVFAYGFAFDLVAGLYLLAPAVLWLALMPQRLARTWVHRALNWLLFCATLGAFFVLAVSEWLFWDEFGGRFNFIAVDYLLYTPEVLQNIWESFPVARGAHFASHVLWTAWVAWAVTLAASRLWKRYA